MRELEQRMFHDFCDVVEGVSLDELSEHFWPNQDHDTKTTLAPLAERHFNSEATQWSWIQELKENLGDYRWLYERLDDQLSRDTLPQLCTIV